MSATDQSNILNRLELSHNLRGSLQRAAAYAYQQSHREVTVEHLLLSLAEDRDAAVILEASNVEIPNLTTEVADYLGRLDDRVEGEGGRQPTLGRDLINIFQSAAAAAQKSQRRAVGSALVLAAIVGEGRSPSAQMLRNHGLTFEQAIAALRQANAAQAARPAPEPAPAPPPAATDPVEEPPPDAVPSAPPPSAAAAPIPSASTAPPSTGSVPVRNVQAARDVLAGARERVAAMGGAANSEQPVRDADESAAPPASPQAPAPKPETPAPTHQTAEPAPPAEPVAAGKTDEAATPAVAPPPKKPAPQPVAKTPPQKPDEPAKPPPPRPAPPPDRVQLDQAPPAQPQTAAPPRPVPPPAAVPPGEAAALDRAPQHRPQSGPPPGAGGVAQQPSPQKPQRRPRWPDWAQQPGTSGAGTPPTGPSRNPLPESAPAQRQSHAPAGPSGPVHPHDLDGAARRPHPAAPPPDNAWQPRQPATRGEAANPQRPAQPDIQPQPPYAPAPAQRGAPVPPAAARPDGPPFDPRTLVEQVPTRMRAGKPLTVHVRVPRRQLEAWSGGGPDPATLSQHVITKAMVMRLKAAPKDFAVENASPETQWSEGYGGPLSDDIVSWRWVVTPRRSGRHSLQLSGATRIVGRDGLAAERPLPPQRISVRVSPDYGRLFGRVATWLIIAALAGTAGYFADGLFDMGRSVLAQLVR